VPRVSCQLLLFLINSRDGVKVITDACGEFKTKSLIRRRETRSDTPPVARASDRPIGIKRDEMEAESRNIRNADARFLPSSTSSY